MFTKFGDSRWSSTVESHGGTAAAREGPRRGERVSEVKANSILTQQAPTRPYECSQSSLFARGRLHKAPPRPTHARAADTLPSTIPCRVG